jgi:serine protease Do
MDRRSAERYYQEKAAQSDRRTIHFRNSGAMYRDLVNNVSQSMTMIHCPDINMKGSGFLIASHGFVVTNAHVVSMLRLDRGLVTINYSQFVNVIHNNRRYTAKIVSDTSAYPPIVFDYAILQIDGFPSTQPLEIGDHSQITSGDDILCFGYPLDFNNLIVTHGIISSIMQIPSHINSIHHMKTFLTNALIRFGNSGGPMIDASTGKVIGINTLNHAVSDDLANSLRSIINNWPTLNIDVSLLFLKDLLDFTLKYSYVGLNYAVSIEYARSDPAWPN